jgi:hypothetical protein
MVNGLAQQGASLMAIELLTQPYELHVWDAGRKLVSANVSFVASLGSDSSVFSNQFGNHTVLGTVWFNGSHLDIRCGQRGCNRVTRDPLTISIYVRCSKFTGSQLDIRCGQRWCDRVVHDRPPHLHLRLG